MERAELFAIVLPLPARILPGVGLATPYVTVGDACRRYTLDVRAAEHEARSASTV